MKKIGLISDTHGYMDGEIIEHLAGCDEIWHAGDIGDWQVATQLEAVKPLRAVHGNIDDGRVRAHYPEDERFVCAGLSIWIRHITGTPGRYTLAVRGGMQEKKPDILVGGHTHLLRVERDAYDMLYLNPGAIGRHGIHQVRTLLRFTLQHGKVTDMEAVELPR